MTPPTDRRHQDLRRDGDRLTDEAAMRAWMRQMEATYAPVRVRRLSSAMPELQIEGRRS